MNTFRPLSSLIALIIRKWNTSFGIHIHIYERRYVFHLLITTGKPLEYRKKVMSERVDGQSQHKVLTPIPEALHYLRDVSLLRRSHHYPQNLINTSMSLRLSRSHLLLMILCHIWRKEGLSERKWRKSSFCTLKTFFLNFVFGNCLLFITVPIIFGCVLLLLLLCTED